ncbi:hypothetical protein ACIP98_38155 [Streptomyces sp. NPDC088354]|uniref:hypothetical protein n=1 Tax=Streptomyces sp. NPDC088354 TaxID=3365856 RepID=UPI00382A6528
MRRLGVRVVDVDVGRARTAIALTRSQSSGGGPVKLGIGPQDVRQDDGILMVGLLAERAGSDGGPPPSD